ncbi:RluA family pseudouridine synthase [Brevibacillus humidisoli]|uniref:RluA family pseudouridine synthase n=1 Tax=Brevibacillus humidisoli TaxID=2895522 RepID=UPI001E465239|nr:RluA family pseudouridine synthase [Brevibacillus humidisoli]UFJ40232.1 RluA family pseudouridine synthase [Brevibacillus humidisoli]
MSAKGWLEYVVTEQDEGQTVEQIVREKLAVSGRMVQRLTRSKGIRLNRKNAYLKRTVKKGDKVAVRIADRERTGAASLPETEHPRILTKAPPVEILYEDDHLLVANKPAGMMVHPLRETDRATLVEALAAHFQVTGEASVAIPHPVHRLDKETSGAVLIAKSSYAHQLADRVLRAGKLHREYIALVSGRVEKNSGTIRAAIIRDGRHPTKRKWSEAGDPAITHYEVLVRGTDTTLVKAWLETGKTHQIRVHFSGLGHPLIGDRLYGGKGFGFFRQALHAYRLSFPHPLFDEVVEVLAPLPEDLRSYLAKAGYDEHLENGS